MQLHVFKFDNIIKLIDNWISVHKNGRNSNLNYFDRSLL